MNKARMLGFKEREILGLTDEEQHGNVANRYVCKLF